MAHFRRHRVSKPDSQEAATALVSPEPVEPVSIDLDELQQARQDERMAALLEAAEAEGACVEREGRQRW